MNYISTDISSITESKKVQALLVFLPKIPRISINLHQVMRKERLSCKKLRKKRMKIMTLISVILCPKSQRET